MSGHTPGPWKVYEGGRGYGYIRDNHLRAICAYGDARVSIDESAANAHLIAAAPDQHAVLHDRPYPLKISRPTRVRERTVHC